MKRILVDGTYLGLQMKGVGRYTGNTLREFAARETDNQFLVLVNTKQPLPPLPQIAAFSYHPIRVRNHYVHGFFTLPDYARLLHADVVWIPYETTVNRFPCPYTIVCHDVPQLIYSSQNAGGERRSILRSRMLQFDDFLIRQSLRRAARVFANSHFVWNWLDLSLNVPRARIKYAPCAPGADFASLSTGVDINAVRADLKCPNGYVLVFATGDRRENFETVLGVFDMLAPYATLDLVVAGTRGKEAQEIRAHLERFAWKNRVHVLPFFGEGEIEPLADVYASASVYLDLSLHEGFGMQVIEAMASGAPVVSSNRGALPEVAGDAALLVDPENKEEIAKAVVKLITDPELRAGLIAAGRTQAANYSWRETAETILTEIEAV